MADYNSMINAFMTGPNAQAGSDWRTAHPRIDAFLTSHPNFSFGGGGGMFGGGMGGGNRLNGGGGFLNSLPGLGSGGLPALGNLGQGGPRGNPGDIPHTMQPPMMGGAPGGGGYDGSGITAGFPGANRPPPIPNMGNSPGIMPPNMGSPMPKPNMTNMGPGVGLAPAAGPTLGGDMARRPIPRVLR